MLIEVLAGVGLLFILIMNVMVFFGFSVISRGLVEDIISRDESFAGWTRSLLDVLLFCLAVFVVLYIILGSVFFAKQYHQSWDKKIIVNLNPPSVEVERK